MAVVMSAAEAAVVAEAVIDDLADRNHALWLAGPPGQAVVARDRFDPKLRTAITARLSTTIKTAVDALP